MKVSIETWAPPGREGAEWTLYTVSVEFIPFPGDDDRVAGFTVLRPEYSKEVAELHAEVFKHYIETFPGAEQRLGQFCKLNLRPDEDGLIAGNTGLEGIPVSVIKEKTYVK
jgi:hypothetical protein